MKTKQELIQIMRNAHQEAYCNADATPDEAWEAALKALCGTLPDVPEVTFNVDGHKHTNIDVYELEDIYNQLKQYGEE